MILREDIHDFLDTIPKDVTVVAATKYVGPEEMKALFHSGVTNFGENRVDPFLEKYTALEYLPITWHFIGHLQRNKAKLVIPKLDYLHSLDSLELAKQIEKLREEPLKCFIEVSINLEESKNGVPYMDIDSFMEEVLKLSKIQVVGFMMMAIKGDEEDSILRQFKSLAELRDRVEDKFSISLPFLSMGMSDDYPEAIESGATHIRLGRILWKS